MYETFAPGEINPEKIEEEKGNLNAKH